MFERVVPVVVTLPLIGSSNDPQLTTVRNNITRVYNVPIKLLTCTSWTTTITPPTGSTGPWYTSTEFIPNDTAVDNRGINRSGNGGVAVGHHSIGWYANVGANH